MDVEGLANQKSYKNFFYFLFGQQFSLLGSSIVYFIIGWWITIETNSAIVLSLSSFFYFLPQIIIAPIAGVLSDRISRKFIIISVDFIQALVTLVLFLLFTFNISNIGLVILINAIRSVLQAFHVPTYNAIVPSMVPNDRLNRANAINGFFSSIIYMIGPILGGIFYVLFPINQIFMIDIMTFLIALVPVLLINIPKVSSFKQQEKEEEKLSFFKEFKIGLLAVITTPGLLSLIFLAMLLNFLHRPFSDLLPLYVNNIHNGTAIELSFVAAFMSIANIVGSFINAFKKEWKHKTSIIMIGSMTIFIGYSLLIITPYRCFIFIAIGLFIAGLSFNFILINYMTILQSSVPPDKVGRVVSLDHSITFAIMPLGSIIGGLLAELIGIKNLYLIFIVIAIAISLLIWIFTDIRKLDFIRGGKIQSPSERKNGKSKSKS